MAQIDFTLVGGPTAVFTLGGLTIMTDPTFDPPRSYETPGQPTIVKTAGPALQPSQVPHPDVVLLSHDHHADNFDDSGRELASRVSSVITTADGAKRLGHGAVGLADYESTTVPLPDGGELMITGVPAHHGPDGVWQEVGPVIGFMLTGVGLPTVYVSGDNSSMEVIEEIAAKFGSIDMAVLFAGGARFAEAMDGAFLTLSNEAVLEAAKIMDTATIVPVHADGWAHFSQNAHQLRDAFEADGLGHRIVVVEPGASAQLGF